jgi:uncharacterized protein YkwD
MKHALLLGLILLTFTDGHFAVAESPAGGGLFGRLPIFSWLFGGWRQKRNGPRNDGSSDSDDDSNSNEDQSKDTGQSPGDHQGNTNRNRRRNRRQANRRANPRRNQDQQSTPNAPEEKPQKPEDVPPDFITADDAPPAAHTAPVTHDASEREGRTGTRPIKVPAPSRSPGASTKLTAEDYKKYLIVPAGVELSDSEKMIVTLTNMYRAFKGLSSLPVSKGATENCRNQSKKMAARGTIWHGSNSERGNRAENVGFVPGAKSNPTQAMSSAAALVFEWIKSEGHRKNILAATKAIGVSAEKGQAHYMDKSFSAVFSCQQFE